jgi:hypothetical protein
VRLADYFPEFASELAAALADAGYSDLGQEFSESAISRCTHDASCNACYIYLEPSGSLNVVESNTIGVKHGRTISVEHPFWVYVDVDNFDRPAGIELLSASSAFVQRLQAWSRAYAR